MAMYVEGIRMDVSFTRANLHKVRESGEEAEKCISDLENVVTSMGKEIKDLSTGNQYIKKKVKDL